MKHKQKHVSHATKITSKRKTLTGLVEYMHLILEVKCGGAAGKMAKISPDANLANMRAKKTN